MMQECNDRTMGIEHEISLLDQAIADLISGCVKPSYKSEMGSDGGLRLEPFNPNLIKDLGG